MSALRICYADPPYPGQARKHYRDQPICEEVNHGLLVAHLETFDGWALSTSASALRDVLALCGSGVRVAAWVKPFCAFKKAPAGSVTACISPSYTWEPVIFRSARKHVVPVRDHLVENIYMRPGFPGAKPPAFSQWIFDLLGAAQGDEFTDLFPGSGAVAAAWLARYERPEQLELQAVANG